MQTAGYFLSFTDFIFNVAIVLEMCFQQFLATQKFDVRVVQLTCFTISHLNFSCMFGVEFCD